MTVEELLARYPRTAVYVGTVVSAAYLVWVTAGR